MLRPRAFVTALIVAIPATVALDIAAERIRASDLKLALDRVVRAQLNEQVRERCDSDPTWFLPGPLIGRPPNGVFVPTQPDQLEPRPRYTTQPYELFGYDEQFLGSSSGTPQIPLEFRRLLRGATDALWAPYYGPRGTGIQMAVATGWIGSRCTYLLGRMEPPPNQLRDRVLRISAIFVAVSAMAMLAALPTIARIRRLARDARASVDGGFTSIAPEKLKDELSSLTFVFNDAMTELALRKARIEDQDATLRRLTQSTDEAIARPLAALEANLAALELAGAVSADAVRSTFLQAHDLRAQVENQMAVMRLRLTTTALETTRVDLATIVRQVSGRQSAFAHARGVTLRVNGTEVPLHVDADAALVDVALSNVVDNAIRYNRPGGAATVTLERVEGDQRFRLWVADNGTGVTEEQFRGLTAVRRFRGDEGRNRRPGAPGLGLAVTQEIVDRFKMKLDLKRPGAGGFEVEISGPAAPGS